MTLHEAKNVQWCLEHSYAPLGTHPDPRGYEDAVWVMRREVAELSTSVHNVIPSLSTNKAEG